MSAEVGGQLEALPPRRSLFGPDYRRLAVLLLAAVGVHAWLVAHTAVPARDSLGYSRIALNLDDPEAAHGPGPDAQRIQVLRSYDHPPGYPLAILAVDRVLRHVSPLPTPQRVLLASQLANSLAAVLLVVPMYLTGRILFGRDLGFAAALLFQVLPVPARVTSDGLSEGVYLLAVTVAILLGVRSARKPSVGGFLLCGMATGASYLVRPEGLMTGMAVGVVIVAAGLGRRWPRDAALGRLVALGVGVALVALPYMVVIGKLTNKKSPGVILRPWEEPGRIWVGQPGAHAPGAVAPLFAKWWNPEADEGKCRTLWALGAVWSELIKALHYVAGGLALLALFVHRRQLAHPDLGLWVPVVLGGMSLAMLVYLAARIGYVSERHTVLLVMLCCILGVSAIGPVLRALVQLPVLWRVVPWPDAVPTTFYVTMLVTALPYTLKPMHPQREGHKHVGVWLAANMDDKDWLKDPLAWAEWYAGRTVYRTPVYHNRPEFTYVVCETGKGSPHSRLPLWDEVNQMVKAARDQNCPPVYRWPEDAPPDGPAVEVYKIPYRDPPSGN